MFDADEIAERQAGFSRHMCERLNLLADRVFDQAETLDQPEAVQAAALTVEKLYRGIRLCMAFETRVAREHRRAVREAEAAKAEARDQVRVRRADQLRRAVGATFIADYEAEAERDAESAAGDPDEALRTLSLHLAAVAQAIEGAQADLDPSGDLAAEVDQLRASARLIARMNDLPDQTPAPIPLRRPGAPRPLMWRSSG